MSAAQAGNFVKRQDRTYRAQIEAANARFHDAMRAAGYQPTITDDEPAADVAPLEELNLNLAPIEDKSKSKAVGLALVEELPAWKAIVKNFKENPSLIPRTCPPVNHIIRVVAAYYGMTVMDILSRRRENKISRSRHIAMTLAKQITLRSYPDIGRRFGRDHTTIMHGVLKIEKLCETDEQLRNEFAILKARLLEAL